ncbi:MAG TPA: SIR2 family protein [Sedimentisphaerales bacterium]|nr:SIR2 family protein [Sedimentisphaerales bacterium]
MEKWTKTDGKVLKEYTRPIVHLRRQFEAGRLVLVFGTGVAQQVGVPGWTELNNKIASDSKVKGEKLLDRPLHESVDDFLENESRETILKLLSGAGPEETITTQRLFECYKKKKYACSNPAEYYSPKLDSSIYRQWRQIIRDKLYETTCLPKAILTKHKYLSSFLPIIRHMPLTITYNFDDILEMALYHDPKKEDSRGYETVTNLRALPRRKSAVIYHPNGYIPRNPMEEKSQEMVLSESEFANRMADLTSGQYNSLLHVLSSNTCLFIGLSLKDSILKNLLKQSARIAPGNYHYYVDYYKTNSEKPTGPKISSMESANFEAYNLKTLFLTNRELKSLGTLVYKGYDKAKRLLDDGPIFHFAQDNKIEHLVFCFYIIGSIGVGKSTCVSYLRSLITHDEWHEDKLPDLARHWKTLEDEESKRKEVDKWIAEQFKQKNQDLLDVKLGISICDRCPLDPISFTPKEKWHEKAKLLLNTISPNNRETIKPGHIIYLWDDPEHLDIRVRRTPKEYDKDGLKELQNKLDKVYDMDGMTRIDCRFQSFYEIMKRICRIIHMENYQPAEIHERLIAIKEKRDSINAKK